MDRGKLFMIWFFFLPLLNLKIKKATTFEVALQPREFPFSLPFSEVALQPRDFLPLPLSILAGTNLITLILFFFATPVWFPRKSIPHSISGKIHPRLISEKIHSKPPKKTKKFAFFLLPVISGSVLRVSLLLCHWI